MPEVEIDPADYVRFSEAAQAAGLTVERWLTEAGRARLSPPAASLAELWAAVQADLTVSARLRSPLRLGQLTAIVENTALLVVPDAFTRDVFESRLRPAVTDALSRRLGTPVQIAVTVRPPAAPPGPDPAAEFAELLGRPEVVRQLAEVLAAAGRR